MTGTRPTIKDVARRAGVAPSTVSKALSQQHYVSQETTNIVLKAAGELGFRPNSVAQSLRSRATRVIGVIADDIEGMFLSSMLLGIEEEAGDYGCAVLLVSSRCEPEREAEALRVLADRQVEGLIFIGERVKKRPPPVIDVMGTPAVFLYQHTDDSDIPSVIPDDFDGAIIAMRHLVSQGVKRIAMIAGPRDYEASQLRLDAYHQVLSEAGLDDVQAVAETSDWYEDSGYRGANELIESGHSFDAVFCASDAHASGAMYALVERGIRVPRDIAVMGFDDQRFAQHLTPSLSTIALPLREMGRRAAQLVFAKMKGEEVFAGKHLVPCSLIVRASTTRTSG